MFVTLDGVVQGLGRPDEDTRDGFTLPAADAWQNSILLRGDAVATVAELKAQIAHYTRQ